MMHSTRSGESLAGEAEGGTCVYVLGVGGWTHALTKGRIKVEVKQSSQGPSMLR